MPRHGCAQFIAGELNFDQLTLLERRAEGTAPLVIGHFKRHRAEVAACAFVFGDAHALLACPGDSNAFMEGFNVECFTIGQITLAVVWH